MPFLINKPPCRMYAFALVGVFIALSEALYDWVFANLAYSITGTARSVTTTYAIGYVAEILVTLSGAGFIDRFNKWKLLIGTLLINISVFLAATITLSFYDNSIGYVWGFAFFVDLIHQYSRLILFALVPFLFAREEIPQINGFLSTLNDIARSVGPAIGAVAILHLGLSVSLAVSIIFMLLALILVFSLHARQQKQSLVIESSKEDDDASYGQRLGASITGASRATAMLFRSSQWRAFLGSYAACVLVISVLALLWIPFLRDFHTFTPEQTGYLFAVSSCGSILGGLTHKQFPGGNSLSRLIFCAHCVMLLGVVTTLVCKGNMLLVGIGMFVFQLGTTVYFRTTASVIQLSVPRHLIGSWYGAIDFIGRFAGLAGILIAGWAYDYVGAYGVYSTLLVLLMVGSLNWLRVQPSRHSTNNAA